MPVRDINAMRRKGMAKKCKNRYVLAEGYPDQYNKEKEIGMRETVGGKWLPIKVPEELFDDVEKMPCYRLVLERMK
jgi:hypothetical protein